MKLLYQKHNNFNSSKSLAKAELSFNVRSFNDLKLYDFRFGTSNLSKNLNLSSAFPINFNIGKELKIAFLVCIKFQSGRTLAAFKSFPKNF